MRRRGTRSRKLSAQFLLITKQGNNGNLMDCITNSKLILEEANRQSVPEDPEIMSNMRTPRERTVPARVIVLLGSTSCNRILYAPDGIDCATVVGLQDTNHAFRAELPKICRMRFSAQDPILILLSSISKGLTSYASHKFCYPLAHVMSQHDHLNLSIQDVSNTLALTSSNN